MRPRKTTLLAEAAPVGWRERPEPVWIPARLMGAGHSASSTRGTAVASGPKGEGVGVGVGVPSGSTIIGGQGRSREGGCRSGRGRRCDRGSGWCGRRKLQRGDDCRGIVRVVKE